MKTNSIQNSYAGVTQRGSLKRNANPNFQGSLAGEVAKRIPQRRAVEIMEKLKVLDGETGRIAMSALGTGIIAPIFIAWNPYVKAKPGATPEEKEDLNNTKKYTAMRQPISAVLAAALQISILNPIDKFLDAQFNDPEKAKGKWIALDKSALQDKKYIERQIAKEMKQENLSFANKEEYKKELSKRASERANNQIADVANKLQADGKIHINAREVDNATTAELLNKTIDKYIRSAEALQIDSNGQKYYSQRAEMLMNNQKDLKAILGNIPQDKSKIVDYLQENHQKAGNDDVKTILQEIIDYPENLRDARCQNTLKRIETINKACKGNYNKSQYLKVLQDDFNYLENVIDRLKEQKVKNIAEVTAETLKEKMANAEELCLFDGRNEQAKRVFSESSTFRQKGKNVAAKIYKDITKGYKDVIGKHYRAISEMAKISIGLAITVPVTCTALNWVYPRFMEIFFPKLAGTKKAQAANKNGGEK